MKKWISICLTALMAFVCLCGCGGNKQEPAVDTRPVVSKSKQVFYGDDNGERLTNPLMGWSYYAFPEEIIKYGIPDDFDVGIIHCSWDQLEPVQGQFDFSLLTSAINRLKNDGKTVYLRLYLMPDNVWAIKGYPDWVRGIQGVGNFTDVTIQVLGGQYYTFSHPDYSNKIYQSLMQTFLSTLCATYEDGFVDVIDARAYGLYGEWDSNWGNYWDTDNPQEMAKKTEVLNDLVDVYKEAFGPYEYTKIAINVPSETFTTEEEFVAYEKEAAYDNAMEAGFALRFDAIANYYHKDTYFFEWLRKKNFPNTPVFSESVNGLASTTDVITSYMAFCAARANIATFGFFKGNYEKIYSYPYDYFEETLKPSERFDYQTIGYRILPKKITFSKEANVGGKIEFSSEWVNTGSGVLYRDYPLCLSLTDETGKEVYVAYRDDDFDLTKLTKESGTYTYTTKFNLPTADKLPAGTYTARIALVDKNNNNKSAIALPIGETGNQSRDYAIGKITIK